MMIKLFHAGLVGILGSFIVFICEIFLLPHFAENDVWSRLTAVGSQGAFTIIESSPERQNLNHLLDPNFAVGVCLFSLEDGPIQVSGPQAPSFWSLSIYNRLGENIGSLNDRITTQANLDLIVATPVQTIELQNAEASELAKAAIVEADINEGFVILRALHETPGMKPLASQFVTNSSCENI